ncbi:hypothetical protein CDAR_408571 [Caerostris darwini]|uniref:Uncharacterized protein n=1 Tax=Caerostris darwini TaxID=1538125 RepID=A0AAV4X2T1_9ARAC|nr:hypothetical protein CDAR_408571 [Caerostris darwini]
MLPLSYGLEVIHFLEHPHHQRAAIRSQESPKSKSSKLNCFYCDNIVKLKFYSTLSKKRLFRAPLYSGGYHTEVKKSIDKMSATCLQKDSHHVVEVELVIPAQKLGDPLAFLGQQGVLEKVNTSTFPFPLLPITAPSKKKKNCLFPHFLE